MKNEPDTKQKILTEALKLFARRGCRAVSVDQIAQAVGVKAPSLYKHYRSKQSILDAIIAEMDRRDYERAHEYGVPAGTAQEMPLEYQSAELQKIAEFSSAQFAYWTEDEFASNFRKMLTLEQFASEQMSRLYHQHICTGPLNYVRDLLEGLNVPNPSEAAVRFFSPMFLLYSVCDGGADIKWAKDTLKKHFNAELLRLSSEISSQERSTDHELR
ncbi:MAG: helix-turn-helix domain-containing protein [Pyramidobacter sp.]|nr:helix-turn-helix domain-containing protein [Pyramidobacter sp.]